MAVITPSTDVYLLKVPLEINDVNQLTFTNATAQYNYFNSLPKIEVHDFTYQRKDGVIRFGAEYDELITYNYVMYRNDAFSNKWFYAFITNMEWKSPGCTDISIKTDVWQSWMFDITLKPVLIDREHVNTDTVGLHTLPEGLELGEMVTNGNVTNFAGVGGTGMSNYCCVVEVTQVENTGESATLSYAWESGTHDLTPNLGSIDRGTIPLVIGLRSGAGNTTSGVLRIYELAGLSEAVVNVYMLPKSLVPSYNAINLTVTGPNVPGGGSLGNGDCVVPDFTPLASGVHVVDMGTTTFTRPTTVDGYTPKNKKVLTWPYCYFNISNNSGTTIPFHYEDFGTNVSFKTEGVFGLSGSTKTTPLDYKNISSNENGTDYSISGPKYPVCSWKSDSYTNWLTQNAVNLDTQWKLSMIAAGTSVVGGVAHGAVTGGLVGAAVGGGLGVLQGGGELIKQAREQHLQKTQANMTPDQAHGNLGAGDFIWAKYRSPYTYVPMSIKAEYARCIDEYFSQYGYKSNRVKVPNITGRKNWNFVKTVGCYIDGDIPQGDMEELKNMFDRGITFWHNPATFADYSQNNDII